jgi:hypothetical protein
MSVVLVATATISSHAAARRSTASAPACQTPVSSPMAQLPAMFCVHTVSDLAAMAASSGSITGRLLANKLRQSSTGSSPIGGNKYCLPPHLVAIGSLSDLDGDGGNDAIRVSYAGCLPRVTLAWDVLDGATGQTDWSGSATGFLPGLYDAAVGPAAKKGLLVMAYDPTWVEDQGEGKAYHGVALSMVAYSGSGHRWWQRSVTADVKDSQNWQGPSTPQLGSLVSGRTLDALYSFVTSKTLDPVGLATTVTSTITTVDGRSGKLDAQPPITQGPTTPTVPSIVGDLDRDGRSDYVLSGGFDLVPFRIDGLPPSVHRLFVDAYSSRTSGKLWSQSYDEYPYTVFATGLRDVTGDQTPDITALVFDFDTAGLKTLLIDGGNGSLVVDTPGQPIMLVQQRRGPPLFCIGTYTDGSNKFTTDLTGYDKSGHAWPVAELSVNKPPNANNNFVFWMGVSDLNGDSLVDVGVYLASASKTAQNTAGAIVGSDGSVHRVAVVSNEPGSFQIPWSPLGSSLRGHRGLDVYKTIVLGDDHIRLLIASGLATKPFLTIDFRTAHIFSVWPTALQLPRRAAEMASGKCRQLLVDVDTAKPEAGIGFLFAPSTDRATWTQRMYGPPIPLSIKTAHSGC